MKPAFYFLLALFLFSSCSTPENKKSQFPQGDFILSILFQIDDNETYKLPIEVSITSQENNPTIKIKNGKEIIAIKEIYNFCLLPLT